MPHRACCRDDETAPLVLLTLRGRCPAVIVLPAAAEPVEGRSFRVALLRESHVVRAGLLLDEACSGGLQDVGERNVSLCPVYACVRLNRLASAWPQQYQHEELQERPNYISQLRFSYSISRNTGTRPATPILRTSRMARLLRQARLLPQQAAARLSRMARQPACCGRRAILLTK